MASEQGSTVRGRWRSQSARLLRRYARPLRDALVIAGLARMVWYYVVQGIHPWTFIGIDARAYWGVDQAHPYAESGVGVVSTYLYSPAFAQLMAPFQALPFEVFYVGWTVLSVLVLVWLVRPWPWALLILSLPISYELFVGQVHLFIAAAIVVGFGRPIAWAFPILTKVTPGLGLLWFAVQRDWRALAMALGGTLGIVAVSYLLSPSAWSDWIAFLTASSGGGDVLIPRIIVGALIVVAGALANLRWTMAVAIWIALPVVWIEAWVILLATIRLTRPPHASTAPLTLAGSAGPALEREAAPAH